MCTMFGANFTLSVMSAAKCIKPWILTGLDCHCPSSKPFSEHPLEFGKSFPLVHYNTGKLGRKTSHFFNVKEKIKDKSRTTVAVETYGIKRRLSRCCCLWEHFHDGCDVKEQRRTWSRRQSHLIFYYYTLITDLQYEGDQHY